MISLHLATLSLLSSYVYVELHSAIFYLPFFISKKAERNLQSFFGHSHWEKVIVVILSHLNCFPTLRHLGPLEDCAIWEYSTIFTESSVSVIFSKQLPDLPKTITNYCSFAAHSLNLPYGSTVEMIQTY